MGQEVANSEIEAEGLLDHDPPAAPATKQVEHSYTRELLLSFADLESCKKRPENLDPVVWRDAPAADGAEGGIAIPANASRGLVRRDSREIEAFSKSPVEIPEWRKDSWRSGGSGAVVPPGPRRKPYDEEPPGNAFSTSYPPRPAGNWGDSHQRNNFERSALQGQGSGRWEHRAGLPDRERELGRPLQKWDPEETVTAPIVPLEALRVEVPRPFGSVGSVVPRPGWLPAERDGLLGSGGGLHRTYTGNFSTPSAQRAGPERQMSMGAPERQMSLGLPERQMGMAPPDRPVGIGPPERQISMGPLERQMSVGPLERQMSVGPPERQMSLGPERQMSMGPLDRQMSMGLPERQNSFGRGVPRSSEPYQPARPLKQGPPFARREETDLVNDETFGSDPSSVDDRTEQERKRREAFELMRKDHQRVLHKQQKRISQKHEERLANPESNASRKHDESALWDSPTSSDVVASSPPVSPQKRSPDTEISSGLVSTPVVAPATPRPAIPPGFAKVVSKKHSVTWKTPSAPDNPLEGDTVQVKDTLKQTHGQSESTASFQEKAVGDGSFKEAENMLPKVEESLAKPEPADSSAAMLPVELLPTSPLAEAQGDVSQLKCATASAGEEKQEWIVPSEGAHNEKDGFSSDEAKKDSFVDAEEMNTGEESLLDKLFGKSKSEKGPSKEGELPTPALTQESHGRISNENAWSEGDSKTSKFAQWFHREVNLSPESVVGSADILSLFPNGGVSGASSNSPSEHVLGIQDGPQKASPVNVPRNRGRIVPMPTGPSLEDIEKGLKENASSGHEQGAPKVPNFMGSLSLKSLDVELRGDHLSGVFGEHSPVGKFNFRSAPLQRKASSRSSPVFLTCEDIEQSMLAQAGTSEKSIPNVAHPSQAGGTPIAKDGQAGDSASRHLLSLLHKGAVGGKHSPKNSWSSHTEKVGAPAKSGGTDPYHDGEDPSGASKTPPSNDATLEALFGKAFMSDLRSTKAPVSANTNISDYFGNADGSQALPGMYPVSRQSAAGRVNNLPSNIDVLQQWPPRQAGWNDSNGLEINRQKSLKDVTNGNQFVALDNEENHTVTSSSHGLLWGNGMASHIPDGSQSINNTGVGNKGSFVSTSDSMSFMVGDLVTETSVKGKGHLSRVHNPELDSTRKSSKVTSGDGKSASSGNFAPGKLRVPEDSSLPLSKGKVLSSDGPGIGPIAALDSSGLPQGFNDDGLGKRIADITQAKFGVGEPSAATLRDDNAAAASQGMEAFLLTSRGIDGKETLEGGLADNIGLGDGTNSGIDRKAAESLSDALGFVGKVKDGNARASSAAQGGFPEQQGNAGGLSRSSSNANRFKNNVGAMQPTPQFNGFAVGPPLQHQQSLGAMYRADSLTSLSRQQSLVAAQQHHLQQTAGAGLAMFPQQQFLPQPGLAQQQQQLAQQQQQLAQQQQLLARTFSNGSVEFPHVPFGHAPAPAPNRQLPAGHLHFPPPPHGHLSPPGAYPPMGPMGPPNPNHFLPPAQMPQRAPSMSPMGDGHMFMQEQAMHDSHGQGAKPGSQQGQAPLFPLGAHGLQSGQGPMFHQGPLPPMRGQQNQLMQGPVPWDLRSYSAELMRTSSKGHELSGFVNGNGGGGGGNSLDRWFGMELSRNTSGIPTPGILQVSPHALDAENKVRFG